jgi:cobalt/nickel transport system permease protein
MHIADGILPIEVSIAADAAALALVYAGGRKLETEDIPRMGIFAAALFIVSLIHFPIGATSIHLGLYGLAGLLFGIRAIPIIFVNLLFQSLIFQHGGLLSIGMNTLTMGSGAITAWGAWKIPGLNKQIKSFFCGLLGVLIPAAFIAVIFVFSDYGKSMGFIITIYIPAAIIEAFISMAIYNYFKKVKPDINPRGAGSLL